MDLHPHPPGMPPENNQARKAAHLSYRKVLVLERLRISLLMSIAESDLGFRVRPCIKYIYDPIGFAHEDDR